MEHRDYPEIFTALKDHIDHKDVKETEKTDSSPVITAGDKDDTSDNEKQQDYK